MMDLINPYLLKFKKNDSEYLIINLLNRIAFYCDREVCDLISNLDMTTLNSVSPDLLDTLKELKVILNKNEIRELFPKLKFEKIGKFADFCIILNWSCNFKCDYCILRRNWYFLKDRMTKRKLQKALEFIDSYSSGDNVRVALTGGEPLLLENYAFVEQIFEYGKDRNWIISIATNGFTLDHYVRLLKRYEDSIGSIYVTLAGPPDVHNKRRVHKSGAHTFDTIVKNIKILIREGLHDKLILTTQFDEKNIEHIDSLVKILSELEFLGKIKIVFQIIVNGGNISHNNKKEKERVAKRLIQYFMNNIELLQYIDIGDYELGFDIARDVILHGKLPKLLTIRCGGLSGRSAILDPNGMIYPCYIMAENRMFPIGKYYPKFEIYLNIIKELQNRNIYNLKEECQKCPLLLVCAGGCPLKDLTREELDEIKNRNDCSCLKDIKNCINKDLMENEISQLFFKFKEFLKQKTLKEGSK